MAKTRSCIARPQAAIYLRVSAEEQSQDGFSLTTQERLCREELDAAYGAGLYDAVVYCDDGFKGRWGLYDPANPRKKFRPALTRMLEAFKAGKHTVLCVWELDRIYRRAALADFLCEHFLPNGLEEIHSAKEDVDLNTASGRFHVNIMAAVGAFETERLGERVSDALGQRRHEGFAIGPPPYGWRWQTESEMAEAGQRRRGIVPVPDEAEVVRWMAEQYLAGRGILTITQELNERGIPTAQGSKHWSRSSVKRVLANAKHAGLVERKAGDYMEGQQFEHRFYEPETFHQLRARIERNAQNHKGSAHVPEYLLGGLLRCGHCGYALNCRRVDRINRRYYRCSSGTHRNSDTMCTRNAKAADLVESVVVSQLREIASDAEVQRMAAEALDTMVDADDKRMREDIGRLEQQQGDLWKEYEFWSGKHYRREIADIEWEFQRGRLLDETERTTQQLEARKTELRARDQRTAELQQARQLLDDFDECFAGLTLEQQREMVHLLVEEASMFHQEDGATRVVFRVRLTGEFERVIPRCHGTNTSLTMRQMEAYKLWGEGLDRHAIARALGVTAPNVTQLLWLGRKRVGADSYQECYEQVKDEIEANADLLSTGRRRRKRANNADRPVLTETQRKVLSLHAEGLSGPEIAERLGIGSENTVYVHLKNCRDRLGRASNDEAARHAREMGHI